MQQNKNQMQSIRDIKHTCRIILCHWCHALNIYLLTDYIWNHKHISPVFRVPLNILLNFSHFLFWLTQACVSVASWTHAMKSPVAISPVAVFYTPWRTSSNTVRIIFSRSRRMRSMPHAYFSAAPDLSATLDISLSPNLEDQHGILLENHLRNYLKPKSVSKATTQAAGYDQEF